jgi:hypothetical protein
MSDPRIEDLTDTDEHALEGERELGRKICRFYLDEDRFDLAAVDEVFDLWLRDPRQKKPLPNEIALGLGSLLGDYLREKYQCRWVVDTDRFGCDLVRCTKRRVTSSSPGTGLPSDWIRAMQVEDSSPASLRPSNERGHSEAKQQLKLSGAAILIFRASAFS